MSPHQKLAEWLRNYAKTVGKSRPEGATVLGWVADYVERGDLDEALGPRPIESMVGVTLQCIDGATAGSECITMTGEDGRRFVFRHYQDCCETVEVADVCGDPEDLIGAPLVIAEERRSEEKEITLGVQEWTFYRFATVKGTVTIRWLGESNGYYSTSVHFSVDLPGEPSCR